MGCALGINYFSHNMAAAIIHDGAVIFGVEEERLSRRRKTMDFPLSAIRQAPSHAGIAPAVLAARVDDRFVDLTPIPYMGRALDIGPDRTRGHSRGLSRRWDRPVTNGFRRPKSRFHRLTEAFHRRTGVPIVLNTSFNLKGEPIVCAPDDAPRTFYTSGLGARIIGAFLLEKRIS